MVILFRFSFFKSCNTYSTFRLQVFATYWLCLFSLYISANKITVLNIYDFFASCFDAACSPDLSGSVMYHTCIPASLTVGEDLAIRPKTGASRAAVEAAYGKDQWLLIYLTVFYLPYPNWLLCWRSLFASSQSLYFAFSLAQTSCMALNVLIFFSLLTCSIIPFFSFFFLCDINPAYFFIVFKNKWKERNVLSLPWSFFSTLLYHFCPTSFVEFW